jgi:uncharacterized protein YggE
MKYLSLVLLLIVPWPAHAQQSRTVPTLATSGTGRVSLTPDRAILMVVVESQASSPGEAGSTNAARVAGLMDSVRSQAPSNDTARLISYDTDPVKGFVNHVYSTIAYKVRSTIRIALDDPRKLGQLIDLVLAAGATEIGEARFESDSLDVARKRAVGLAVREAQSTGEAAALAAGIGLGDVFRLETQISDGEDIPWARGYRGGGFAEFGNAETESPRGRVEVSAQVAMEWRIHRN